MSEETKVVHGVEIKDEEVGRKVERGGFASSTYATEAYPGHDVDYPTCSMPSHTNKGCDAWNKCKTKGKGPYNVPLLNPANRKTSVHCRNWFYKLQYKQAQGYQPVGNPWEQAVENEWVDENDHQKGVRERRYKFKVENTKNPLEIEDRQPKAKRDVDPTLVDEIPEEVSPIIEEVEPTEPKQGIKHADTREEDTSNESRGEGPVGDNGNRKRSSGAKRSS